MKVRNEAALTGPAPKFIAVTSFFPIPQDRGDPVRVLGLLKSVSAVDTEAVFLACSRSSTSPMDVSELRSQLKTSRLLHFNTLATGDGPLYMARNWILALKLRAPTWIVHRMSPDLSGTLSNLRTKYPDAVVLLLGEAAGVYSLMDRRVSRSKVHWDKSNVLGASTRTQVSGCTTRAIRGRIRHKLSFHFERRVIRRATSLSVTSSDERARVAQIYGADAMVWPSSMNVGLNPCRVNEQSNKILWLGSMNYPPNYDGLVRFVHEASGILAENSVKLVVVGSGATMEQREALDRSEQIDFRGYVESLESVVSECRGGVVPVWEGAGIKIKTLTMMSLGLPVVSTTVGFEGLPGDCALGISDDSVELVSILCNAGRNDLDRARAAGLRALTDTYSLDAFHQRVTSDLTEMQPPGLL